MAKNMARIIDGVVTNLEWVDDVTTGNDTLKDIYDLQVQIGDTYADGVFYRDGIELVTFRNKIRNILNSYDTALTDIASYIPATMYVLDSDVNTSSIESRKQLILSYLSDAVEALDILEVTSSE